MTESETSVEKCPACGFTQLSYFDERQVWVCDDCSFVISDADVENCDVNFGNDESTDSTSTDTAGIDWQDQISISDKSEKNLIESLSLTEEVGKELEMEREQITRAGEIVTDAWSTKWTHGRTMKETVAASIYVAGREAGAAIPPGAIGDVTGLQNATVKSNYVTLKNDREIDLDPPLPSEYVEFIVKVLNLPEETGNEAKNILESTDVVGGNPIGIAGGAVYVAASEQNLTLKDVAEVAHLTKETIWKHSTRLTQ